MISAVKKASFLGIVNGKKISGDKTWFCPNEPITRQEAAKMLYAMTMIGQNTVIPKASSAMLIPHVYSDRLYAQTAGKSFVCPGSWALSGIDFCYNSGVLTGAPGNRFDPGGHFTREQAYLTMLRMYRWAAAGGLSATASGVRFLYYDAASGLYGYRGRIRQYRHSGAVQNSKRISIRLCGGVKRRRQLRNYRFSRKNGCFEQSNITAGFPLPQLFQAPVPMSMKRTKPE